MQVVLPSAKDVIDFEPNFDEIKKCPGSGIIITGAPSPSAESKFDFYTRMFCPKSGINEVLTLQIPLQIMVSVENCWEGVPR